jgi:hypothetical protein
MRLIILPIPGNSHLKITPFGPNFPPIGKKGGLPAPVSPRYPFVLLALAVFGSAFFVCPGPRTFPPAGIQV